MQLLARICLSVCLLIVTACQYLSQKPQARDLIDPPSIDIENSLESGYFTIGDWPQDEWWTFFDSPQLNGLMQEALAYNPTILAVQQRIEAANEVALVARSKLFPWLAFDAVYENQYLSKNGLFRALNPQIPLYAKLYDLKLTLNYDFDFWGKYRELFKAALGNRMAQEAEEAEVKLIVTTSIAQAYVALKQNQIRRDLVNQLILVRKDIYELQDFLQEKSLASKLVVLSSEENLYEAKKLLWAVEEQLAISQHQLNVLAGRSPNASLDIGCATLSPIGSLSIPCNLSLDLLARRPDLMAQIWRAESLAHQVGAAKTEYYPDISLSAFLGLESVIGSRLFKSSSFTDDLRPALHLPLFTAGAIQANIDTQMALFREAIFEYNQLLLTSAQQVADDLALAASLFKQKRDQAELLKSANGRSELTDLLYRKGLSDQITVDIVKEEVINAELEDLDITYNQYIAMIQLIKDLGGGYESLNIPIRTKELCE